MEQMRNAPHAEQMRNIPNQGSHFMEPKQNFPEPIINKVLQNPQTINPINRVLSGPTHDQKSDELFDILETLEKTSEVVDIIPQRKSVNRSTRKNSVSLSDNLSTVSKGKRNRVLKI